MSFKPGDRVYTCIPITVQLNDAGAYMKIKDPIEGTVIGKVESMFSGRGWEARFEVEFGPISLTTVHLFQNGYGIKMLDDGNIRD